MALRLYELANSRAANRTADTATVSRSWIAMYSPSHETVYAATLVVAPPRFSGYRRQKIDVKPSGGGVWMCEVEYGFSAQTTDANDQPQTPSEQSSLGPEFSFDATAQQVHITQSLETKYRQKAGAVDRVFKGTALAVDASNPLKVSDAVYTPVAGDVGKVIVIEAAPPDWVGGSYTVSAVGGGQWTLSGSPAAIGKTGGVWGLFASGVGTASNYKQAIGVTRDRVEGCDVYAPKLEMTETHPRRGVSLRYIKTLRYMTGRTNSAAFRGFAAGEVLYLGASGSASAAPDAGPFPWKVTHKFAVGENLYNVVISSDLGVPKKGAHEYLWCTYDPSTDANKWVQTAAAAYVERVYREGNFSLLEIGA